MPELTEAQIATMLRAAKQTIRHGELIPYDEGWHDKAADDGTNNHAFEKVAPGRLRMITHAAMYNDVSAGTFSYIQHYNGHELVEDEGVVAPAIGEILRFAGMLILGEGQYMAVSFEGCNSGDDLYAVVNGYEIILEG